jgi:hypothetical protein
MESILIVLFFGGYLVFGDYISAQVALIKEKAREKKLQNDKIEANEED